MATIRKEKRDKIVAQALQEVVFARQYKQGKVANWQKNEDLYYGKKLHSDDARANVDLARMQEFVHTILSKIDNPLVFKFTKRKAAQKNRVEKLNALRSFDSQRDNWDIKDLAGKKQAVIYGRAIYSYGAESKKGYTPHLENVDVYDFLIDPSAGGLDIERALYMGRYGVVKMRKDLEEGVKSGKYIKTEANQLLNGSGNAVDEGSQEDTNKDSRTYGTEVYTAEKEIGNEDKYKFWEWYTTYEGERYYVLLNEDAGSAIRVVKLKDIFESDLYPFWTWSAFLDLTEFWTPSYCDYVREIFMAQSVSINQMLDNAEQINKPQRVVDVTMIENLSELKYRKNGLIKSKGDVTKTYKAVQVPSIDTPLKVFDTLETIQEKSSGVTAGAKGLADGDEKATIYQGNQANVADRFGLLNKSYSFGYKRFSQLWQNGVQEHLKKKVAIEILGPEGVSLEEVSRNDIFRKNEEFGVAVEASDAEEALSIADKRIKLQFLGSQAGGSVQNQQKAYEISASIVGFTDDEIRQLMETDEFGDADVISEAERDIEAILDGKEVKPNRKANLSYKQRFIDYIQDHEEDIDDEDFIKISTYIDALEPIIEENIARIVVDKQVAAADSNPVGLGVADETQSGPLTLPGGGEDISNLIQ